MSKQMITRILENYLGEYILNISKENLKVGVIRGKIKLDNVQLDGDLIGSHILGAVGLAGFAVLSCWARKLRIIINWSKLEKEPTRIEIKGMHLVCVPLLASTTHLQFGKGTQFDPKCSLRTRVKRSALARYERNFFAGRIEGEGPSSTSVVQSRSSYKGISDNNNNTSIDMIGDNDEGTTTTEASSIPPSEQSTKEDIPNDSNQDEENNEEEQTQNWKAKLKAKMLRNIEASIKDLHIRCEVPEKALDHFNTNLSSNFSSSSGYTHNKNNPKQKSRKTSKKSSARKSTFSNNNMNENEDLPPERSAFAFGFTLESFVVRTDLSRPQQETSKTTTTETDNISVSGHDNTSRAEINNKKKQEQAQAASKAKIVELNNMAVYWDDKAPFLISHSFLSTATAPANNISSISSSPSASEIADMMDSMIKKFNVHPNHSNNKDENKKEKSRSTTTTAAISPHHEYLCDPFSLQLRLLFREQAALDIPKYLAELLPCKIEAKINPQCLRQYQKLKVNMIAQQRLDTMLHQRPEVTTSTSTSSSSRSTHHSRQNSRKWWKYAIACVMTRPNSRPWRDVRRICQARSRYIQLVTQKIMFGWWLGGGGGLPSTGTSDSTSTNNKIIIQVGYHCGLSPQESQELLKFEDLLPIEALLAFHLVALRDVVAIRMNEELKAKRQAAIKVSHKSSGRFRRLMKAMKGGKSSSSSKKIGTSAGESSNNNESTMYDQLLPDVDSIFEYQNDLIIDTPQKQQKQKIKFTSMYTRKTTQQQQQQQTPHHESSPPTCIGSGSSDFQLKLLQLCFKVHNLSFACSLVDEIHRQPIIRIEMQTNGLAQSFDTSQKDVVFEVKQFDVVNCIEEDRILMHGRNNNKGGNSNDGLMMTKLLTVAPPPIREQRQRHHRNRFYSTGGSRSDDLGFDNNNPTTTNRVLETVFSSLEASSITPTDTFDSVSTATGEKDENILLSSSGLPYSPTTLPNGVVYQVYASMEAKSVSLHVTAHPATLVWEKNCIDALQNFFSSDEKKKTSVFSGQLRNAATPLVLKSQMALMSPQSLNMNINVNAPKLWIPVSSDRNDGALYLDAGHIKMNMSKMEYITDTNWEVNICEIQVKFNRQMTTETTANINTNVDNENLDFFSRLTTTSSTAANTNSSSSSSSSSREEIVIIRPFDIRVYANIKEAAAVIPEQQTPTTPGTPVPVVASSSVQKDKKYKHHQGIGSNMKKVNVIVGKIYFNLIDVEIIAKAIGRMYAAQIARRVHKQQAQNNSKSKANGTTKNSKREKKAKAGGATTRTSSSDQQQQSSSSSLEISMKIDSLEMALQTFNSSSSSSSSPATTESSTSTKMPPPSPSSNSKYTNNKGGKSSMPYTTSSKRTYSINVVNVTCHYEKIDNENTTTTSRFSVHDINILQKKPGTMNNSRSSSRFQTSSSSSPLNSPNNIMFGNNANTATMMDSRYLILVRAPDRQQVAPCDSFFNTTNNNSSSRSPSRIIGGGSPSSPDHDLYVNMPSTPGGGGSGMLGQNHIMMSPIGSPPVDFHHGATNTFHSPTQNLNISMENNNPSPPHHQQQQQHQSPYYNTSDHHTDHGTTSSDILHAYHVSNQKQSVDEIEIDVKSFILRLTPTCLRDCAYCLSRIFELGQLMTKEMERKVHEKGRLAALYYEKEKQQQNKENSSQNSDFSILYKVTLNETYILAGRAPKIISPGADQHDTTFKNNNLTSSSPGRSARSSSTSESSSSSAHVLQLLSNTLIMFQSVENFDGSGKKTLHMSLQNTSASLTNKYEPVSISESSSLPVVTPTAAELRLELTTENQGSVVIQQDLSVDCENFKACLTPDDGKIISSIFRKLMKERSLSKKTNKHKQQQKRNNNKQNNKYNNKTTKSNNNSFMFPMSQVRKRGSGIATRVRFELQNFSIVLLRAQHLKHAGRPLFDLNITQTKGKFDGCLLAMRGELSSIVSLNFFSTLVSEWEYICEPTLIIFALDHMPNEFMLSVASRDMLNLNLTGVLLNDLAAIDFDFLRSTTSKKKRMKTTTTSTTKIGGRAAGAGGDSIPMSMSGLSTSGRGGNTTQNYISFVNETGLDILICSSTTSRGFHHHQPSLTPNTPGVLLVENGQQIFLDSIFLGTDVQKLSGGGGSGGLDGGVEVFLLPKITLGFHGASAQSLIGTRKILCDLPIATKSHHSTTLRKLEPAVSQEEEEQQQYNNNNKKKKSYKDMEKWRRQASGSPIMMDEDSTTTRYHYEPVVEWCIQNQRLRGTITDIHSVEKGKDLLSSQIWSPGDEYYFDIGAQIVSDNIRANHEEEILQVVNSFDSGVVNGIIENDESGKSTRTTSTGNWLKPYLKNDVPEWTDMTYILRLARERVMLPDPNWIWVNDWSIDKSGVYGETTDADGWEYGVDFSEFNKNRRYYVRGDCCRRRRWTRTRIVKPPMLEDLRRPLNMVWETQRKSDGCFHIKARSPVTITNSTSIPLAFFAFSASWNQDQYILSAGPGETKSVPVPYSSATYIRIARRNDRFGPTSKKLSDYSVSGRIMILPTSFNSSNLLRTSIKWLENNPITAEKTIKRHHFLIHVKSIQSVISVFIEPVLQIINLLPCQIQCKLGEFTGDREDKNIVEKDVLAVDIGGNAKVLTVCSSRKPQIQLRAPGYKWSNWCRIANRVANSDTWRPCEKEEMFLYNHLSKDPEHQKSEYKSVVRLDRVGGGDTTGRGDSLMLIMGVEIGHTPILRIWAQYWIMDKTGFGLRFGDATSAFMSPLFGSSCRQSYLSAEDLKDEEIQEDLDLPGHEWSLGMSGMSLYFSSREKIAFRIESGATTEGRVLKSSWSSPMDVSNVMPKTVFSLEESSGPRKFELSFNVSVCPSIFSRTKIINVYPRYQIVNLLQQTIFVAQDGCLESETIIPSQTSVPFHWDVGSLAPKVRLKSEEDLWTNGCIRLDKIGITSMRLPMSEGGIPVVIQAEVRLATTEQTSAVVIVIWSANEESNPLYLVRNKSSYTILCSQSLEEEKKEKSLNESDDNIDTTYESWTDSNNNNKKGGDRMSQDASTTFNHGVEAFTNTLQCRSNVITDQLENFGDNFDNIDGCAGGASVIPWILDFFLGSKQKEFIWRIPKNNVMCFGFEDPEKPHVLKWTCVDVKNMANTQNFASLEVDGMGSSSILTLMDNHQICCQIKAEHSTKVIEFTDVKHHILLSKALPKYADGFIQDIKSSMNNNVSLLHEIEVELDDDEQSDPEFVSVKFRVDLLGIAISVVDNISEAISGREILYLQADSWMAEFSQSREGYHEMELKFMSLQVDNHVTKTAHPVLIFCPRIDENEPFLHMSAVRRLQSHTSTYVFCYAAFRILEIDIFLDRRTAETVAQFLYPLKKSDRIGREPEDPSELVYNITSKMASKYAKPNRRAPRDIEKMALTANSGRIYFEELHLHPVRLSLTFTQEWIEWSAADTEGMLLFQFIRGMASIAGAPLTFTSFVVSHAFEAPQAFGRIIGAHYSSQLTKQIFGILGSLTVLALPADFLANVGTGVRDFFYEPINGIIHGPQQFIEGLEAGTQSLARGLVVGVVRGAANVTDVVNSNLAVLTDDNDFIHERELHRRLLTDALSRGATSRTISDSLYLAGASVARGVKSGAMGIVEQPSRYAARHGPVGLLKGVGKALVGAIVKPVVGVGDAAVLMMNHVSEVTSDKDVLLKIPKRLRRALPRVSVDYGGQSVQLVPYDDRAAKAQKIVTAGESLDDIYIGHVSTTTHLIIASEGYLWAIDINSRKPWCLSWDEISHFTMLAGGKVRITIFSQSGLKPYIFKVDDSTTAAEFHQLLSMQVGKMGNCLSNFENIDRIMSIGENANTGSGGFSLPGIKAKQVQHLFGSCNTSRRVAINITAKDDIEVIEQCYERVKKLGSSKSTFFKSLDEEAWNLVSSWGQVYSGLSSRRCITAGFINAAGCDIQVKTSMLVEGGSPCYAIPTKEFDQEQGILYPGGAVLFFGWGVVPSLTQNGRVFMNIETSAFMCDLSDRKSKATYALAMPGFEVGFLEKSYDESGWWAKYWLLVRKE